MDVFTLAAKITFDSKEYDAGLKNAEQKAEGMGSKVSAVGGKIGGVFGKMGSAIKTGIETAAKVTVAAVGAASVAVGALVKKSVDAYGEYEQLVGGVNKLYGNMGMSLEEYAKNQGKSVDEIRGEWEKLEKAQTTVLKNAQNAYKTAGMSTNQYLETATSFSASLINDLGGDTQKAADMTDMAMRSISDNWNTFGGDLEGVINAYKGFSKGTFTMLDNLKLGYGGTKEEMDRLIADANEYAKTIGQAGDLTKDSFADIVQAIELVQQKQQIAGTTAREATTTIQGSLGMVRAAWENLITGLADKEADFDTLMSNLVDSVAGFTDESGQHVNGFLDNIIPVAEKAIEGVGQLIERIAPIITEKLPGLIQSTLPSLISAAATLVSGVAQALPDLAYEIIGEIPGILDQIGGALKDSAPQFFDSLGWVVSSVLGYARDLIWKLEEGIRTADWAKIGKTLADNLREVFDLDNGLIGGILYAGTRIVIDLAKGIGQAAPELVPAAIDIITNFVDFLFQEAPALIDAAVDLVIGLATGLTNPESLGKLIDAAYKLIMSLADGLIDAIPKLIEALPTIIDNLVQTFTKLAPKLMTVGPELMIKLALGLIQAIPSLVQAVPQIVASLGTALINYAANLINAGKQLIERVKQGFESLNPMQWGRDLIDKFVQGITGAIGKVGSAVSSVASAVSSRLHFSEPDIGPLKDFHTYAPDMMKLFAKGIKDNEDLVALQVSKSFDIGGLITSGGEPTVETSNGGLGRIEALLMEVINGLSQNIYLDTGVLVGATAGQYNNAFGTINYRSANR